MVLKPNSLENKEIIMLLFNLLADTEQKSFDPTMLIFILAIIAIFVFMTISGRKQRKKQAEQEKQMLESLCKGTKILTKGGIMGVVSSVDHEENTFVLDSEGSLIKFDMRAIYQMTLPEDVKKEEQKIEVKEEKEVVKEEENKD